MRDPMRFAAKMSRQTPRNLQDVPSAFDIGPSNAPTNIHSQSAMQRMKQEYKQEAINKKNSSYKKILGDI
jgi:hypothetical protein